MIRIKTKSNQIKPDLSICRAGSLGKSRRLELLGRTPELKSLCFQENADLTIEPIHKQSQPGKAKGSEFFAVKPIHTEEALPFALNLLHQVAGAHKGLKTLNDRFIYEQTSF
jgi:hypothetical protein